MTTPDNYVEGSTSANRGSRRTRMIPSLKPLTSQITPSSFTSVSTPIVWHFWSPSSRAALPPGKLEGCTVAARVKISPGALLQIGMDYWRSPTIPYGSGGNNREAGASNWYCPSPEWQEATFTDIRGPQF